MQSMKMNRVQPRFASAASRPQFSARVVRASATATLNDVYICMGLAHCFEKNAEGKLVDRFQIEPISASSLECMAAGARTSFKCATGMRMGDVLSRDKSKLPPQYAEGVFCEKFEARCEAAARTWLRPHAQDNLMDIVPLGKTKEKFNFSLDDKRVLNVDNEVSDSDNIKQDMSIDVYGRKDVAEKEADNAAASKAAELAKVEDELESLLTA